VELIFNVASAGPGSERLVLSEGQSYFAHSYRGAIDLFETIASRSRETGAKIRVSGVGVVSAGQEQEIRALGRMLTLVGLSAASSGETIAEIPAAG
jgi:hypothetical protein